MTIIKLHKVLYHFLFTKVKKATTEKLCRKWDLSLIGLRISHNKEGTLYQVESLNINNRKYTI